MVRRVVAGVAGLVAGVALLPPGAAQADGELAPIMVVLDASGSMKGAAPGGTKMTAARKAVRTLVSAMPAQAQVGLTVYGANTGSSAAEKPAGCKDVRVVHPVGPLDKAGITKAVDAARPRGYTPIGLALRTAAGALPQEGPRAVVLVSDGEDTCAPPDPCEVARELAEQGVQLRVHTVGYQVDGKARRQLTCIAQATGGTYTDVPDASGLGRALTRVTSSALRNYQPAGTAVTGAFEMGDAPVLTPGAYVDTLGFTRKQYYSVEIPDGYTAYFAATVPLGRAGGPTRVEGLNGAVYGVDGADCAALNNELGGETEAVSTLVTWTVDRNNSGGPGCQQAGRYTFVVYFTGAAGDGPPETGSEDRLPLEMQVGLEPPVADPGPAAASAPVEFSEPAGPEQPITGGGSFGTAATLPGSGQYAESLQFGEEVYYRVRVDWGQGLAYQVAYGEADLYADAANIESTMYSPARGRVDWDTTAYTGRAKTLPSGTRDAFATLPIRYQNRNADNTSDVPHATAQGVAGWYYIAVKLGVPVNGSGEHAPVPVTLKVSLVGTPEPGPRYADVAAGKGAFGGTSDATPPAQPESSSGVLTAARSSDDDSGPLWWLVGGIGLGAVLAAAVVVWLRLASRRRGQGPVAG
jgi:Ca-activated chloride channel family protein